MKFGPDDKNDLDPAKAFYWSLNPGSSAHLTFSAAASQEQALIIYDQSTMANVVEKGTYTPLRNLNPVALPKNSGSTPIVYVVTGWNKPDGPNSEALWSQSRGRVLLSEGIWHQVGFDDSHGDSDFDDITVTFQAT